MILPNTMLLMLLLVFVVPGCWLQCIIPVAWSFPGYTCLFLLNKSLPFDISGYDLQIVLMDKVDQTFSVMKLPMPCMYSLLLRQFPPPVQSYLKIYKENMVGGLHMNISLVAFIN